ncbi:MAG: hypothetical protein JNM02_03850 [Anaerolineales bacterium]|nr:hypothetical protein [Anaerolineales bacterium]
MNKKNVVVIVVFAVIFFLLTSLFVENNKREAITITSYASEVEMNLDELIGVADLIVVGDFLNIHPSRWSTANGKLPGNATIELVSQQRLRIFADSDFQVTQYLKGDVESPIVRIRTFGGQVGEDSMIVSGQPKYKTDQTYLLFLFYNTGTTAKIDPGSYYGTSAPYEITDGKAVSVKDEWVLEDLIAYIQKSLSTESPSPTFSPVPTEFLIETLTPLPTAPTETPSPAVTFNEFSTETPTETVSPTP